MKQVITYPVIKSVSKALSAISLMLLFTVSAFAQSPCNAHYTFRADSSVANNVHFTAPANPVGTTFYWGFGDGTTSQDPNPAHTYSKPGTYWVCLYVGNPNVCTAQFCDSIHVGAGIIVKPICNAQFQHYSLASNADSVHFYANYSNAGTKKFFWTFGDGGTSDGISPWHFYAHAGTYYACLTVTDSTAGGTCSATWCDSIHVAGPTKPVCNAQFNHYLVGNTSDSVHFYSGNHTSTTKFSWSFGDGGASHDPNPSHKYAPGNYLACLTVTDSTIGGSCSATWCDSIHVAGPTKPICNAQFQHYSLSTNPDSVHFYSGTHSPSTKFFWTFGDGGTSDNPNPFHYYQQGNYLACLTVKDSTSAGVCTATWCDSIHVAGLPKPICNAKFSHYALLTNPDSVHFYTSPGSSVNIKYSWSFGDGTGSNLAAPWHFYANPGTYYVCLTVKDSTAGGTCTSTVCDSVHVSPPPPPPTCDAHFKASFMTNIAFTVKFTSATNPTGTVYNWNFGDNTSSGDPNPTHTYAHDGTYYVCLTVINTGIQCYQTICDSIRVPGFPKPNCNAKFSHYSLNTNPDSVKFYVTPTNSSHAKYAWTFGDGGTSQDAAPWHFYAPGKYQVCLTVTDSTAGGTCSSSWCDSVRVEAPRAPICDAHFKFYPNTHNPDSIHFYPASTIGTSTRKYSWSFGDGGTSKEPYPWHLYPGNGVYYVCLTVTDSSAGGKCTDTQCDSVRINVQPPVCNAHFTHLASNIGNTNIKFIPSPNPPGTKYLWNFGDGSTSTNVDPYHLYANYGTYYVCLTVTDSTPFGVCSDTWCDSVRAGAKPIPCDAHFKYQYAYYVNSVYFIHAINPPDTKYSWDFGDGSTSTVPNALHQYANPGSYLVCLTVNDSIGNCKQTFCDSVHVGASNTRVCNSNFYFKPGNALHSLYFFSSPNPPATKYLWSFGDGTSSTDPNPFHQYAAAGTYKVCLTVSDCVAGCSDMRCLTIGPLRMANGGSTLDAQGDAVVNVYPNPMKESGTLHIENTSSVVTFRMYDHMGRLVKEMTNLSNGDYDLSNYGLGSGIYLYEVSDADNNSTRGKLIIQQ